MPTTDPTTTDPTADPTTAFLQEDSNISTDSSTLDLKRILLLAGLAAGGALVILLIATIVAFMLIKLIQRKIGKNASKKSAVSSSTEKNIYNTLDVVRPTVNSDNRYSTLEPDWLSNNAYQSHVLAGDSEFIEMQVRETPSIHLDKVTAITQPPTAIDILM